jgi:hypothetical protein
MLLLLMTIAVIGCGMGGERGKNKDYDRPTREKK